MVPMLCINGVFIVLYWCLKAKGTMHEMTKNDNRALMHGFVSCCWLVNTHELSSVNIKLSRNLGTCVSLKSLSRSISVNAVLSRR